MDVNGCGRSHSWVTGDGHVVLGFLLEANVGDTVGIHHQLGRRSGGWFTVIQANVPMERMDVVDDVAAVGVRALMKLGLGIGLNGRVWRWSGASQG